MSSTPSTNSDIIASVFSDSLPSAGTNGGVGLSDPATASQRRSMLDLINRLRNTGVQRDIDLPMIAVIGNQSAGKSSLIESISGITLPRSQGTCTRCPTECKLTQADTPWTCVVKLHFITDERGSPIKPEIKPFGDPISDKVHVEERIRRAQRAILNPKTNHEKFLEVVEVPSGGNETSFSRNYVSLEISGRELADLSFVDLPGLIASVGLAGNVNDIELVKNLVTSYIEKPSCLILLTVACETDIENQGARHLAKQYDPKGTRTVGVLTKPDRIPRGEEESWIRLIRNEVEPLDNNWYCVKQPSSHEISQGINWVGARNMERDFFATTKPWSGLDSHLHQFLGTSRLTERLSAILAELIARRLPEIQEELQAVILQAQSELGELPPEPSSNPVGEIHRVLNGFTREVSECLKGTPDENGLVQTIRTHSERFKREIYFTAPSFVPWERKDAQRHPGLPAIKFLSNEENIGHDDESDDDASGPLPATLRSSNIIYIDEVMQRAKNGRTRELPDYYPFVVQEAYISTIVKKWQEPAIDLFDIVNSIMRESIEKMVDDHFAHLGKGGVKQAVLMIVYDHLDLAAARAKEKMDWLLQVERAPATLNTHYYSDYRDKFLAYYRGCRDDNRGIMSNIRKLATDRNRVETVNKALSSLKELGISTQVDDLARLIPSDPLEVALGIMASVRGYFQVAYKRFVDMVPLAIDYEMVRGLERGLDEALLDGLQVTGADAHERCAAMLQEPAAIASKRQELSKKLERLRAARTELKRLTV
ncbi:P-loop containing nucleoside triphosphate hydrolase protein [Pisolithus orientalis]|uniref:P-loop containing nucleoside triphosphate hydrolase protein n=1 Tax=Pisolithus orientalis TaxID=936130 RepID=UPI0022257FBF|nr:P-loop containing nucleoside triphosphate hydrolase protein [Pisolithus orientalis]KAI6010933.1 P-loop containing nucleoside triphosphate hydrolase protein [Pisolithus orientalis]